MIIEDEDQTPVTKKKKGPITKLIGDLFESQRDSPQSDLISSVGKASRELELYKCEQPVKDLDSDPLIWWK